jgi:outer membrane protein assembly factor BamD
MFEKAVDWHMTTLRRTRFTAPLAFAAVLALLTAIGPGCASKNAKLPAGTTQPDKWLYERGTQNLQAKKYVKAREYFRQILDSYPQSPFRPDAKLGVGDAYLGEGTAEALVYAQNEFREFLTFYPTNARADYAQFKLAMTHFKQMPKPERDQTQTKEAITELTTFLERYPNSTLLPEGKARLRDARNRLGLSEYGVGLFYYRSRWYPGAIDRFSQLLANDPEYSYRDAVYYYYAEALSKVGKKPEALTYLDRLEKEFDKSQYLLRGKRLSDALKADLTPGALTAPVPKKF